MSVLSMNVILFIMLIEGFMSIGTISVLLFRHLTADNVVTAVTFVYVVIYVKMVRNGNFFIFDFLVMERRIRSIKAY